MISEKDKRLCEQPLGRAMVVITKTYWGALSKKLEHIGIDRHFTTMVAIDKAKEKCTQQYLSDFLNMDKVSMVRVLDYLVDKGMITRGVNPNDRREHIIQLTLKGNRIMPEIHNGIAEMNKTALNGISKSDQGVFKGFIEIIIQNLKNLPVNEIDVKIKK
ncbi:MAG: MarR family winged helix-turn-helix transcriptional regulator [Bacteroidota bacterium]